MAAFCNFYSFFKIFLIAKKNNFLLKKILYLNSKKIPNFIFIIPLNNYLQTAHVNILHYLSFIKIVYV